MKTPTPSELIIAPDPVSKPVEHSPKKGKGSSRIGLIIRREYLTRVRQRTFIVMTLLGPILFGALLVVPALLAVSSSSKRTIHVIDNAGWLARELDADEGLAFVTYTGDPSLDQAKQSLGGDSFDGLLLIPSQATPESPEGITLYFRSGQGFELEDKINQQINAIAKAARLRRSGVSEAMIEGFNAKVPMAVRVLAEEGEKDSESLGAAIVGYVGGLGVYIFIFLYGVQVMRGVIEEKTSRIVEVIITSVRPFELMMGKIIGIGLVSLTQFIIWVTLSFVVSAAVGAGLGGSLGKQNEDPATSLARSLPAGSTDPLSGGRPLGMLNGAPDSSTDHIEAGAGVSGDMSEAREKPAPGGKLRKLTQNLGEQFPPGRILGFILLFLGYFLGGYLLYSAMFAAIASAVDSETDTQQFMLPITIPLLISIMAAQFVMRDPTSGLAVALSLFPLTSPVVMMVRVAFGPPAWQIATSLGLLVLAFIGMTWLASRIYRVGILSYGKKPSFRQLGRWILTSA